MGAPAAHSGRCHTRVDLSDRKGGRDKGASCPLVANPANLPTPPQPPAAPPSKMSWPEEKPKEDGITSLASGESLLPGQYIVSPNDTARATLEENGCLTIFKLKGKPTVLTGKKVVGSSLNNQEDGNLVLATDSGDPAGWATETAGGDGAYVTLTDDGVLQYTGADGVLLWDSKDGKPKAAAPGAPAPGSASSSCPAQRMR